MEVLRRCTLCGLEAHTEEDLELFCSHPRSMYGRANKCHKCRRETRDDYNYDTHRAYLFKVKYNITLQDYTTMLEGQNNKCLICDTTNPGKKGVFFVDHNHNTGEVRGLLCNNCNSALGKFGDSTKVLLSAIKYLSERGNYGS